MPACAHSPISVLFLGLRSSTGHFYPQHRDAGVPLAHMSKTRVHVQAPAESDEEEDMMILGTKYIREILHHSI